MKDEVLHRLQERVKELTALHKTARILQDLSKPPGAALQQVANLIPSAWQYPEVTAARIRFDGIGAATDGFRETVWRQSAALTVRGGHTGQVEVFYLEERPPADEGPFLKEERDLIESLAEMLRSYFRHLLADEALKKAHADLEKVVAARTEELRETNAALRTQISEHGRARKKIELHQRQLRQLALELSLAEERERKEIAEDLHDHIGQALAFIKMSVAAFRGDPAFVDFRDKTDEILALLDQTIRYTRDLTLEISPPALYELGLEAALDGLAERFRAQHGLSVVLEVPPETKGLDEEVVVLLYRWVQELLTNVVKHAGAGRSWVRIRLENQCVRVEVEDDGRGFDPEALKSAGVNDSFGLFNIREKVKYLGGEMDVKSSPGAGTTVVLVFPTMRDDK
jgi:signal transduction histidine kinase